MPAQIRCPNCKQWYELSAAHVERCPRAQPMTTSRVHPAPEVSVARISCVYNAVTQKAKRLRLSHSVRRGAHQQSEATSLLGTWCSPNNLPEPFFGCATPDEKV